MKKSKELLDEILEAILLGVSFPLVVATVIFASGLGLMLAFKALNVIGKYLGFL